VKPGYHQQAHHDPSKKWGENQACILTERARLVCSFPVREDKSRLRPGQAPPWRALNSEGIGKQASNPKPFASKRRAVNSRTKRSGMSSVANNFADRNSRLHTFP
jgi:hypothetical protein